MSKVAYFALTRNVILASGNIALTHLITGVVRMMSPIELSLAISIFEGVFKIYRDVRLYSAQSALYVVVDERLKEFLFPASYFRFTIFNSQIPQFAE